MAFMRLTHVCIRWRSARSPFSRAHPSDPGDRSRNWVPQSRAGTDRSCCCYPRSSRCSEWRDHCIGTCRRRRRRRRNCYPGRREKRGKKTGPWIDLGNSRSSSSCSNNTFLPPWNPWWRSSTISIPWGLQRLRHRKCWVAPTRSWCRWPTPNSGVLGCTRSWRPRVSPPGWRRPRWPRSGESCLSTRRCRGRDLRWPWCVRPGAGWSRSSLASGTCPCRSGSSTATESNPRPDSRRAELDWADSSCRWRSWRDEGSGISGGRTWCRTPCLNNRLTERERERERNGGLNYPPFH